MRIFDNILEKIGNTRRLLVQLILSHMPRKTTPYPNIYFNNKIFKQVLDFKIFLIALGTITLVYIIVFTLFKFPVMTTSIASLFAVFIDKSLFILFGVNTNSITIVWPIGLWLFFFGGATVLGLPNFPTGGPGYEELL